jgi:hypothetical protein
LISYTKNDVYRGISDVRSNMCTTTTLGTPNLWPLLKGGRCSKVGVNEYFYLVWLAPFSCLYYFCSFLPSSGPSCLVHLVFRQTRDLNSSPRTMAQTKRSVYVFKNWLWKSKIVVAIRRWSLALLWLYFILFQNLVSIFTVKNSGRYRGMPVYQPNDELELTKSLFSNVISFQSQNFFLPSSLSTKTEQFQKTKVFKWSFISVRLRLNFKQF